MALRALDPLDRSGHLALAQRLRAAGITLEMGPDLWPRPHRQLPGGVVVLVDQPVAQRIEFSLSWLLGDLDRGGPAFRDTAERHRVLLDRAAQHLDDVLAYVDYGWMRVAIDLSYRCPPSRGAYAVGAVLVDANGREIARGYSRETDPTVHAEEAAFGKVADDDPRLAGATLYSTLELCSERKSRPVTCVQHVLRSGVRRVVIAWREPDLLVADCIGVEALRSAGVTVDELPGVAEEARAPNAHMLGPAAES
ncbi:hypothetical protein ACT1U9_04110 [Streptomyces sp. BR1]|uniref:hypothetical protein n=1 Tax=Streptomyces sp. BR1 TaxID=1592323 RepID=UPI00402BB2AB